MARIHIYYSTTFRQIILSTLDSLNDKEDSRISKLIFSWEETECVNGNLLKYQCSSFKIRILI